jgi:glutaredoxin
VNKIVVLYSNGCPRCKQLENLLIKKNINYIKSSVFDEIINKGFYSAPVLEINNNFLDFDAAVQFLNERK